MPSMLEKVSAISAGATRFVRKKIKSLIQNTEAFEARNSHLPIIESMKRQLIFAQNRRFDQIARTTFRPNLLQERVQRMTCVDCATNTHRIWDSTQPKSQNNEFYWNKLSWTLVFRTNRTSRSSSLSLLPRDAHFFSWRWIWTSCITCEVLSRVRV